MEERLRSDGDARIIAVDMRFNKEVSEQLAGNRQIVDIQEDNGVPNSGVLNRVPSGVPNRDNSNGDDAIINNGSRPAPATPNLALETDSEGNNIGAQVFPEDDDDSDTMGLLQAGMPRDVAKDFTNIYELRLIQGASRGVARAKVAELFSPSLG